MEQLLQQVLGMAQALGDGLKAQALAVAPEQARPVVEAMPSLLVLLVAVFCALVVLQVLLSVLFGGGRKRKAARAREIDEALAQARREDAAPRRSEPRADAKPERRGNSRPAPPPPQNLAPPALDEATARGDHALMIGDLNAARSAFDEAERVARAWAGRAPDESSLRTLARTLLRVAETRQRTGDAAGGKHISEEAVATVRAMARNAANDPGLARELAVTLERVGALAAARGDKAGARQAWEEELAIANRLAAQPNAEAALQRFIAVVHVLVGNLGESDAYTHYDRALRHFEKFAQSASLAPDDAQTYEQLRAALGRV